ncbi:MAG: cytochrome c [Chitinophagaceae bacterium]|nr:cytochrome c [Chitinophagaceae bacterium]
MKSYSHRLLSCFVLLVSLRLAAQKPTWSKDIAPIITARCAVCHHKGTSAPFNLLTYEDAARRASFIKRVVQEGYMPPWKADPHYVSFANERILTPQEKKMIVDWVDAGIPQGEKTATPAAPVIEGTRLGRKPDLVIALKKPFLVKGDNQERFVVFCLPYELPEERNVAAIEFSADNYKLIHHVNFGFHATFPGAGRLDLPEYVDLLNDPGKYANYNMLSERLVYYSGWIPGATYESYPGNMGWVLPKRGMVLLYMHYAPSPVDREISGEVHIFFKEQPIERMISVVNIGTGGKGDIDPPLVIPPDSIMTVKARIVTRQDQSILFAWPHMHLLGKSMKAYAVTPAKDTVRLIYIPQWDFNWQDIYQYPHLVKIPAGSVITVEATYDNTKDNPRNPFSPPRTITSDQNLVMKTTDEMLNLLLIYLPYQQGDESVVLSTP